jgi:hypothetical protein
VIGIIISSYTQKLKCMEGTISMKLSPLEKLSVAQILKNAPTFHGTRRFITVLTRAALLVPILSQNSL